MFEDGEIFSPWGHTGSVLYTRVEESAPKPHYQCLPPDDFGYARLVDDLFYLFRIYIWLLLVGFVPGLRILNADMMLVLVTIILYNLKTIYESFSGGVKYVVTDRPGSVWSYWWSLAPCSNDLLLEIRDS